MESVRVSKVRNLLLNENLTGKLKRQNPEVSLIPFYDYLRRSSAGDHERGSTRDRDLTRRGLMY